MASASITIRAVQALASGDVLWDGGHKEAVRGFGVRRQRDQATYVLKYLLGDSAFSRLVRTGRLGRRRKLAAKPSGCWDWSRMGKTQQTPRWRPAFRRPTHSAKLPINTLRQRKRNSVPGLIQRSRVTYWPPGSHCTQFRYSRSPAGILQPASLISQSNMVQFPPRARGQRCPQCSIGPFEKDWISQGTRCSAQIVPSSQSPVIGCCPKQN